MRLPNQTYYHHRTYHVLGLISYVLVLIPISYL